MSVRDARCGCGKVERLPHPKAKHVICDDCHRARSHAAATSHQPTRQADTGWYGLVAAVFGARSNQIAKDTRS